MAGNIIVQNGDDFMELHETLFENEDIFQSLIEKYPNILAGEQINPDSPRKWVLISREMGVSDRIDGIDRRSIDHLFADQDAIPTFVEVKRSTDTRIRREVVAQMLDYAANGTEYWSMNKIRSSFMSAGGDLSALNISDSEDEYWKKFESNLRLGKVRLLFVADEIPMELRRIIEFLNDQMKDTEVLGVEIKQYSSGGDISTFVPRVVGQTAKAIDLKENKQRIKWTEKMFLDEAEKIDPQSREICNKIIAAFRDMNARFCGSTTQVGSPFGGGILIWLGDLAIMNLYVYKAKIGIELPFQYMAPFPYSSDEKQLEIIEKLNTVPGISIDKDKIHKRPNLDVSLLKSQETYDAFINVFREIDNERNGN